MHLAGDAAAAPMEMSTNTMTDTSTSMPTSTMTVTEQVPHGDVEPVAIPFHLVLDNK